MRAYDFYLDKMQNYCQSVLQWLVQDYDRASSCVPSDVASDESAVKYFRFVQQALIGGQKRDPETVIIAIEASRSVSCWPTAQVFLLWIQALALVGRAKEIPDLCWDYAQIAMSQKRYEVAVDACLNLVIEDLKGEMQWGNHPTALQRIAALYEQVAGEFEVPQRMISPTAEKFRIGIIVPNFATEGPPYARRVLHFARYLDADKYELFVYSSEGLSQRTAYLSSRFLGSPSLQRNNAELVQKLESYGAKIYFTPVDRSTLQSVCTLVTQISNDSLDALVVQSGVSMPIDWLATRLTPVPVKLHIHIGLSNYLPGLDYTLFDNAVNMEREKQAWPKGTGQAVLLRRGTDIAEMDAVPAGDRARFGIPQDAVVVGALSNNFSDRFSIEYAEVLCEVMNQCPNVWFMPVGSVTLKQHIYDCFQKAGVGDRVHHVPCSTSPAGELKMMDIYASEFPRGGSQSVVEALVCGLPVVAMRVGDGHYESISADIAGPTAIQDYSPALYRDRLIELVRNPQKRKEESIAARQRAEQHFSIRNYVNRIAQLAETIHRRKNGEAVDEHDLLL